MENINLNNVGVANLILTSTLINSYINENFDNNKNLLVEFFTLIKNSPVLDLELKVINNIENKNINDNTLGMRYIDDNIKLFEMYSLDEIQNERKKIGEFAKTINKDNVIIDNEKVKLYEHIETLIDESLKFGDEVNVDNIHESFEFVLNFLKNNKKEKNTISIIKDINEDVINIAINKFNEKYSNVLNENDFKFLRKIISLSLPEKKTLFEQYKNDNLVILNSLNLEMSHQKINESIEKLKKMNFNPNTVDKDLIRLYELEKNL